ncbi:hypothetical protein VOLCADRAFT_92525 [Volvox carteri f. nagariensis]|uniref:Uncharacterized protein n=1 Tax=Volvox carteri f. nagariensis TaxID=3068 RepID=D8TZW3_VOLCA|nr:uncharacterized protein VOLCADRAFT_92525 [Volvox carteri f. nagariensis]EFJ46996.1 hypothetical protein VOLCADRAFT_92525 [Volvox carteri f. nagariensis]|eukprot:XP_002951891.1 hypothetical protein VOLCADRAFT_92525 [Volvox carteri f. nagariensis]
MNGSLQIYPPVGVQPTDSCPDAPWKKWKLLHTSPPDYDPLHWSKTQWQKYIVNYPLRSAGLSLAFFLIGLGALLLALTWRLVQWCVSCGHCQRSCGASTDDTRFLGDTKHRYLKAWTYLLIAGALSMVVWGMLAMDRSLVADLWDDFNGGMKYGNSVSKNLELLKLHSCVVRLSLPPSCARFLQGNLMVTIPDSLRKTEQVVTDLVGADRLGVLVQTSFNFSDNTVATMGSLRTDAGTFYAALNGKLLPGLAVLSRQLGGGTTEEAAQDGGGGGAAGHRRRLAQSTTTTSSSYGTLYGALPALNSSLPVILTANSMRATILGRLQTLQSKLAAVAAAPSLSPGSTELLELSAAMDQSPLSQWDTQLAQINTAFQVYAAARTGAAFKDAKKAADDVVAGASFLTATAVTQLHNRVTVAAQQLNRDTAFDGVKALREALVNISQELMDVSSWAVNADNGTKISIVYVSNFLVGALNDYIAGDTSNGLGATLGDDGLESGSSSGGSGLLALGDKSGVVTNVTAFLQAVSNVRAIAASLNNSAAAMSGAAATAANTAAAGPDPAASVTQVTAVFRPALAALNNPIGAVATALMLYGNNPRTANAAALRAAASNAATLVGVAATSFAAPLANAAGLEAASRSLQSALDPVQILSSSIDSTAQSTYDSLVMLGTEIGLYQAGLEALLSLMSELPDGVAAKTEITTLAYGIQDKVSEMSSDVLSALGSAATGVQSALDDLQQLDSFVSDLLSPGNDFSEEHQQKSKDINDIAYPAAMGAWGLGAALLLLLAVSIHRNWPAGIVMFGLALLVYITLSQVITSAGAFAMGALRDGCDNVEQLAMTELVEHSNKPKMAVMLSFYLFNVPPSQEVMMQAAFNLNVSNTRLQLAALNQTLMERIESSYSLRGTAAELVNTLHTQGSSAKSMFEGIMNMLRYDAVHGRYKNAKSTACCDTGNFGYHEWCAITAMAALSFGALVSAAYLLARMDGVRQRKRGCCSCCSCACYKSHSRYSADEEEAHREDQFVKEAKKIKELQQGPGHLPHPHPQPHPHYFPATNQPLDMGGSSTSSGMTSATGGVVHGGGGVAAMGIPAVAAQLPVGFMTAAASIACGVAVAGAALRPPAPDVYAAPSAPPMTFGK